MVLPTRRPAITAGPLAAATTATASHRGSGLRPLREVLVSLGVLRQGEWGQFVRNHDLGPDLPGTYEEAIAMVAEFADPVVTGEVTTGRWDPVQRKWQR